MTFKEQDNTYTVEQAYSDLVAGLEIGIQELQKRLNSQLNSLSKNEMRRMLDAIINYPNIARVSSEREEYFLKNLLGLRGCQISAEIHALASQFEQEQNKEQKHD